MDILKLLPVFVLILSSFGVPMPIVNAEDMTEACIWLVDFMESEDTSCLDDCDDDHIVSGLEMISMVCMQCLEANDCENVEDIDNIMDEYDSTGFCSNCSYDFTTYGSECCDSAWENYGLSCIVLEGDFNWDCAGCECLGDDPDAGCEDGYVE